MKIGQLFLPKANYVSEQRGKLLITDLIHPQQAPDASTPYLLYEVPVRTPQFVCFVFVPTSDGGEFNATVVDLSPSLDDGDSLEGGVILEGSKVWEQPPLCWQLLLKNAKSELQPFLASEAPFSEVVEVWIHQPTVYATRVDHRKEPGMINRQNSFIIMAWGAWQVLGWSTKERIADMERQGYGTLSTKAFDKRALRLGLSGQSACS